MSVKITLENEHYDSVCVPITIPKMMEERATDFALKEIRCESVEELECWGTELIKKTFEEIRNDYIRIATEQKEIDDAERKSLIEKIIWLFETSYYDTQLWTHNELVKNINEDLLWRAEELEKMFG